MPNRKGQETSPPPPVPALTSFHSQSDLHRPPAPCCVPMEVLCEVLCASMVDEHPNTATQLNNHERDGLLNLCLVSKAWRDAAFSRRNFGAVSPCHSRRTGPSHALTTSKVVAWLNRPGSVPKRLELVAVLFKNRKTCHNRPCRFVNPGLGKLVVEGVVFDGTPYCIWHLLQTLERPRPSSSTPLHPSPQSLHVG
ncbi:hypothetical protein FA13DRAFT_149231 [Coprinellus micaceus]|uniref:F-box domain-containing protein n=1 Tax=Coprinellus micaceus TaxID=71717 RepID=A0A4Y7TGQ3_COPMI|nr:hypothetical protein FA13DRAFT_149231 [Coprinellus micaceus]